MKAVIINTENGETLEVTFKSTRISNQHGEVVVALLYPIVMPESGAFGWSSNDICFYVNTKFTIHIL